MPKVSIIIPIYNVEKYLMKCVDSVRNQTVEDIEIILVDDESPDNCPDICNRLSMEDNRISVIHKLNGGLGLARNSGLEVATGEYVFFVDSDDYLRLDAVEVLYNRAKEMNLDICFGGIYSVFDNGKVKENVPYYAEKVFEQPALTGKVLKEMLGSAPKEKRDGILRMSVWQGIYRREWIKRNNLHFCSEREFISEDIIFHLDALPVANRLGYVKECLYYHITDNSDSLTHKFNPSRFEKAVVLYLEEKRKIELIEHNDGMTQRAQRLFLGNVRAAIKQIVAKSEEIKDYRFARNELLKIVNNQTVKDVLNEYPYRENPPAQAIMSWLIIHKFVFIMYILTRALIKKQSR